MDVMIEDLMGKLVEDGGSDLHLSAGMPPYGRFNGQLRPMTETPLQEEDCNRLIFMMLNNAQRKQLEQTWELDCSYGLKGVSRFRVNVYRQRGTYAACLRALGNKIPTLDMLGLPPIVEEMSRIPKGLVLVTGPTGSGKTTTLAAMLDHINHTRAEHILTIEDPIEFTYRSDKSMIHQRQLNRRHPQLRQCPAGGPAGRSGCDPGGGNARPGNDPAGISAAETGHLVFGTLHTSSASQTVDRMVDVFPPVQQDSDSGAAEQQPDGGVLPDPLPPLECETGPIRAGDGPGDHDQYARHRQSDPRGQDRPALFPDADRCQPGHADPGEGPGGSGAGR